MLGHKLYQHFSTRFETFATIRKPLASLKRFSFFDPTRVKEGVDLRRLENFSQALAWANPTVVINATGIIKQSKEASDPIPCLEINSLLPHRLALICQSEGIKLINISTDCVFSGSVGNYTEQSPMDAHDLYGQTKFLGEAQGKGVLTLRTSMIGRELETCYGLVEWFLAQKGKQCQGFTKAIFSGFTTLALCEVMAEIITNHSDLTGLYHVSSEPISKYDLLQQVNEIYDLKVKIEKETTFVCNRSLNSSRFQRETGWQPTSWQTMITQMHQDPTPYDNWK